MAIILNTLRDLDTLGFDTVIDARSPAEFAEDHLPGAVNLPVLDDAQRARVGTIYKQVSPFLARKVGGALVARNVAGHLDGPLADRDGGWRPLIYCWRGGQRSGAFAAILTQVGWRVDTLAGGYRSYRRLVVQAVYETPVASPVVVLDGNTGTAKTEVLARLTARGVQVIDLEGLAQHRGSVFGDRPGGQPSQRAFEGRVAATIGALDPARPVVVEAESSRIGLCNVPPMLWAAMCAAPRLELRAPVAARAAYLVRAYADMLQDRVALATIIDRLRPQHAATVIARWQAFALAGQWHDLAAELMEQHYDPRYARQRRPGGYPVDTDDLDDAALDRLADGIAKRVTALAVKTP